MSDSNGGAHDRVCANSSARDVDPDGESSPARTLVEPHRWGDRVNLDEHRRGCVAGWRSYCTVHFERDSPSTCSLMFARTGSRIASSTRAIS